MNADQEEPAGAFRRIWWVAATAGEALIGWVTYDFSWVTKWPPSGPITIFIGFQWWAVLFVAVSAVLWLVILLVIWVVRRSHNRELPSYHPIISVD